MPIKGKCVKFKRADFYYFSRCVGMDKVPEKGNNPLGMEFIHFHKEETYLTDEFDMYLITEMGDKSSRIVSAPKSGKIKNRKVNHFTGSETHRCSIDSNDTDSIHSVMSIDYTSKSLQPLTPIQRKKCLEEAGVLHSITLVSGSEPYITMQEMARRLVKLRQTRQMVGCRCQINGKKGVCNPAKCQCSIDGVSCQSDGNQFPCRCGPGCCNPNGRRIYLVERVRYHYAHTLERVLDPSNNEKDDMITTESGDCALCVALPESHWTQLNRVDREEALYAVVGTRKRNAPCYSLTSSPSFTAAVVARKNPCQARPQPKSSRLVLTPTKEQSPLKLDSSPVLTRSDFLPPVFSTPMPPLPPFFDHSKLMSPPLVIRSPLCRLVDYSLDSSGGLSSFCLPVYTDAPPRSSSFLLEEDLGDGSSTDSSSNTRYTFLDSPCDENLPPPPSSSLVSTLNPILLAPSPDHHSAVLSSVKPCRTMTSYKLRASVAVRPVNYFESPNVLELANKKTARRRPQTNKKSLATASDIHSCVVSPTKPLFIDLTVHRPPPLPQNHDQDIEAVIDLTLSDPEDDQTAS